MTRNRSVIYEIDGVEHTYEEFSKKESTLSDNRQYVFIRNYTNERGQLVHEYEEMTDGQFADYQAGVRE